MYRGVGMNTCKYCGDEIPDGYYCCESCWDMYEEPIDETEEIYEDEDFSEKDFGDEEDE
jgi:hypothetical protein